LWLLVGAVGLQMLLAEVELVGLELVQGCL
jgi:hypothetical protein